MEELIGFCRYWRLSPRQVDDLDPEEYRAMSDYAVRDLRARAREARKASRGRG